MNIFPNIKMLELIVLLKMPLSHFAEKVNESDPATLAHLQVCKN